MTCDINSMLIIGTLSNSHCFFFLYYYLDRFFCGGLPVLEKWSGLPKTSFEYLRRQSVTFALGRIQFCVQVAVATDQVAGCYSTTLCVKQ